MKKLFFAIYFISACFLTTSVFAGTREVKNPIEFEKMKQEQNRPANQVRNYPGLPEDSDELREYIRERAKKATKTSQEFVNKNSGMSIIRSDEFLAQQAQGEKSTFQKIYEQALDKVSFNNHQKPADILPSSATESSATSAPSEAKLASELALEQYRNRPVEQLGFDVIDVELPNGETISAPAKEHIPYLSSKIEIMPNGLVKIKETVTVIANGEKLKYGLSKALPKYSISRENVKNSTIPYLTSVKINNTEIEYVLKDEFDRFLITPKKQFPLQNGIYTYEFDYILDRKLWYYEDFNEFYWDVTGSYWNLAVTNAIATVRLPINIRPLGQTLMTGFLPNNITTEGSVITLNPQNNILGFKSALPLFAGEGMHMLVRIPKEGFIEPDFGKKFKWFMEDYGDILFALFGLGAILCAYLISWKNIDKSATDNAKIKYQRTPALYRMLVKGIFDKVSFGAFLLDMYKRGIINITKDDKGISLIKKTDNLKSLTSSESKALKQIFTNKDVVLSITPEVAIKLKKAYDFVEKDTNKRLKWLLLKLNAGYVLFSALMVILVELAISYLSIDMLKTFGVLFSTSITIALYWFIFNINLKNKWIRRALKLFAVILIALSILMMTVYVHFISALIIVAMIYTIFTYSKLFAKREGLIRHNIAEANNLMQKLKNNAEQIIIGYEFATQQPNIYALDADDKYNKSAQTENVYKLDIIPEIIKIL